MWPHLYLQKKVGEKFENFPPKKILKNDFSDIVKIKL